MDSCVNDASSGTCNGIKPYSAEKSTEGACKAEEEEDEAESRSLLHSKPPKVAVNGGIAKKRQRSTKRRVQWNDRNGKKLVEVLEFEPSDSSDSEEDEYGDSCICTIM